MRYLGIICSSIIIVIVPFLFKYFQKKESNNRNNTNIIKQPILSFYIGFVGCIFTDVIIPLLCFLELDPTLTWYESLAFCSIIIIPLNFLYIYLLLMAKNWKIIIEEECIVYYNLFNKKRIYMFSEYTIKIFQSSIRIVRPYINKKNIKKYKTYLNISAYCLNSNLIIEKYNQYIMNHKKS